MATKRKQQSTIEKLGLKSLVDDLLESGLIYDDIVQTVLQQTEHRISKSMVSRHQQNNAGAQESLTRARADANALLDVVLENPDRDMVDAGMQMLLAKMIHRFQDANDAFETADLYELGKLFDKLSRTKQRDELLDIQRERLNLMKANVTAVADKVVDAARGKGLDAETLKTIREEIYGLVPQEQAV